MKKNISPPCFRYRAYLLRCLNETPANLQTGLRMTLIDLRTGEQWGFATPERLVDFLNQSVLTEKNGTGDSRSCVLPTNQIKKRS
jgi:hypothetical protein